MTEPNTQRPASRGRAVVAVIAVAVVAVIAGAVILSDSGTPKPKHATVEPSLAPPPSAPAPPPLVIDEHPAKEIVPSIEEQPELMTEQPDITATPKRKGSGTKHR